MMIAMALGLVLVLAAVLIVTSSKQTYALQENLARLQENGRFALRLLVEDVRMAGYAGLNVRSAATVVEPGVVVTNDCGGGAWAAASEPSLMGADDTNPYAGDCVPAGDYKLDTDMLAVRRSASTPIAPARVRRGGLYLYSSLTSARLFQADADGAPDADAVDGLGESPAALHPWVAHLYYLRPWSVTPGDAIATLVRERLVLADGTLRVAAEPLVEYVEDMQFLYGLDTDGDAAVDAYLNATAVDQRAGWPLVSAVRIELLLRAPAEDHGYLNARSYELADRAAFTPRDAYRRQQFSATVFVRNHGLGT